MSELIKVNMEPACIRIIRKHGAGGLRNHWLYTFSIDVSRSKKYLRLWAKWRRTMYQSNLSGHIWNEKEKNTIYHKIVTNLSKHSTIFDENILYLLLSVNLDSSRGIAFVEFNTVEEAKQWMDITQVSAQSTRNPLHIRSSTVKVLPLAMTVKSVSPFGFLIPSKKWLIIS